MLRAEGDLVKNAGGEQGSNGQRTEVSELVLMDSMTEVRIQKRMLMEKAKKRKRWWRARKLNLSLSAAG